MSVTGVDPTSPGGSASGLNSYDIYVSTNGGSFIFWTNVLASEPVADFTGQNNTTYAFYSQAIDSAGNREPLHITADTQTTVSIPPTSSVLPLPIVETTYQFLVQWSGEAAPGGSPITGFDVYVSSNGGPFMPWLLGTTDTSALYSGTQYELLSFYSIAHDAAGGVQPPPSTGQTVTIIARF